MVYICSTHANQVVEVLAPIFAVYENVRGATQRMKDSKTKKIKDAPVQAGYGISMCLIPTICL